MRSLIYVITAIVLVVSISFASNLKKELIGRWQIEGETEVLEFLKENTVAVVNKGKSSAGKYKFIKGNRIKMSLSGESSLAGSQIFTILISNDVLTLIDMNGKVLEYLRVQLTE